MSLPASRRLIVNADDCGMSPAITEGIVEGHLRGLVTSTTVVVTPDVDLDAVRRSLARAPGLGVGIHLSYSWGHPCLPPQELPGMVDHAGRFRSAGALLGDLDRLDPAGIAREAEAQIARFIAGLERAPDHLDYHQHLVCFSPGILRAVLEVAARHRLPVRSFGHFTDPVAFAAFVGRIERENGVTLGLGDDLALAARAEALEAAARSVPGIRSPDRVLTSFYGAGANIANLLNILHALEPGTTELMCHPALPGAPAEGYEGRARELAILTDPAVLAAVEARGIELVPFAFAGSRGSVLQPSAS